MNKNNGQIAHNRDVINNNINPSQAKIDALKLISLSKRCITLNKSLEVTKNNGAVAKAVDQKTVATLSATKRYIEKVLSSYIGSAVFTQHIKELKKEQLKYCSNKTQTEEIKLAFELLNELYSKTKSAATKIR